MASRSRSMHHSDCEARSSSLPPLKRDHDRNLKVPGGFRRDFINKESVGKENTTVGARKDGKASSNILSDFLCDGGDDRLVLDRHGLNKYQTPAFPRPDDIHRSSCTSNCITDYSFRFGQKIVEDLLVDTTNKGGDSDVKVYRRFLHSVRERIRTVWDLPFAAAITLTPSGTDAEFLPFLIALGRVIPQKYWGHGVLSIVCAAGEVGSGTTLAATGRHFSDICPRRGMSVKKGKMVFDLPPNFPEPEHVDILLRDQGGVVRSQESLDLEVIHTVESALGDQGFKCVVVHMVTGSKTGHLVPSMETLSLLCKRFGPKVLPVVDACQGRMLDGAMNFLLSQNFIIMTTGSKFYGGPPFAGAVILPQSVAEELNQMPDMDRVIGDLLAYVDDFLLSDDLPNVGNALRRKGATKPNYGALVRWAVALFEIERYHDIAESTRRRITLQWVLAVQKAVRSFESPLLASAMDEHTSGKEIPKDSPRGAVGMMPCNTIINLVCKVYNGELVRLDVAPLRRVHALMARDLSPAVEEICKTTTVTDDERIVLAQKCYIGQPVALQNGRQALTFIRIAAGAPLIIRIFEEAKKLAKAADSGKLEDDAIHAAVKNNVAQDCLLMRKIIAILTHWHVFKEWTL
eukprot:GEMP01013288.1.p1 GENE.GEMP01013288.1~~GEMP01013288.1.p1  ORF type:complete len:630 (+),score=144.10 GEMP01013288.1:368-2257(+)